MPRFLVVDDDPAFRDGLAETLRDLGHEAAEAAGEGAVLFRKW